MSSISTENLDKAIFGLKPDLNVISQYVYIYLSNQRQSNASTKDRSEVRGGGKKPWKQKGTGRARFGSSRNPIWKGGGVAFGPTPEINHKKKAAKNFIKSALKNSLSYLNQNSSILISKDLPSFENVTDENSSFTKKAIEFIAKNDLSGKKVTIVTNTNDKIRVKAFSNIEKVKVIYVKDLNAYDVFYADKLLVESDALEFLTNKLSNK